MRRSWFANTTKVLVCKPILHKSENMKIKQQYPRTLHVCLKSDTKLGTSTVALFFIYLVDKSNWKKTWYLISFKL